MRFVILSMIMLTVCTLTAIEVSGTIVLDTTWSPADNPYQVTGNIEISAGITLNIEPGVQVHFMDNYFIKSLGTMIAQGTQADSIIFTSGQAEPTDTDWLYLEFNGENASESIISYARIEYCNVGVKSINAAAIEISYCNIRRNGYFSIFSSDQSNTQISSSRIKGECQWGISSSNSDLTITNSIISDCDKGIYVSGYSNSMISGCDIFNNNQYGIHSSAHTSVYISDSSIHDNLIGGIYGYVNNEVEIIDCNFYFNALFGIEITDPVSVTITGNFINASNTAGIKISNENTDSPFIPIISNNSLTGNGTGVILSHNVSPVICENTFYYNIGNALTLMMTDADAICEISYNLIQSSGEVAIYIDEAKAHIFKNNLCNNGIGMQFNSPEYLEVVNNIFFYNQAAFDSNSDFDLLEYNLFWENDVVALNIVPPGLGELVTQNYNGDDCDIYSNLYLDPAFAAPELDDFHLSAVSPAIDAGNPDPFYQDHDGTIGDIGTYFYQPLSDDNDQIAIQDAILKDNYPNPFNPETMISFTIPSGSSALLSIFNIKGQLITKKDFSAGTHSYNWIALNQSSGIYFYSLQTGSSIQTRKMLLLK